MDKLRPETPRNGLPWRAFALDKSGSEENMKRAFSNVAAAGEPDGARFDFDRVASAPNTMDAHRLILYAETWRRWPSKPDSTQGASALFSQGVPVSGAGGRASRPRRG